jgi:glycosyltransferase involved in cell wall biosynthesis
VLRADKTNQMRLAANPKIEIIYDSAVDEVLGNQNPNSVTGIRIRNLDTGDARELEVDGLFVAIGHVPATELFYGQLDLVYVNSAGYQSAWIERGIPAERLRILPRGLDTELYHPSRREPDFWTKRGVPAGKKVLLYVGRVSKEKDLDVITAAWHRLQGNGTALAFVGDGPYLSEMREALPAAVFTGYLGGLELARAFASSELFLFPSTTDTFGNVVIEALASGLPCIVSDQGGPKDLIEPGVTGYITPALDAEAFATQIQGALADATKLAAMRTAAREAVENRDWRDAARKFWAMSADPA